VEITNATWPRLRGRDVIYDEIAAESENKNVRPWAQIEQVYRQLKQNYEDRRDYERASDFHYGEKQMRRRNPETPLGLRCLLTLYWLASGYGERVLRPLICAAVVFFVSMGSYLWLGLSPKDNPFRALDLMSWGDWLHAAHYTFRVMTLVKPDDLAFPLGFSQVIFTIDSVVGPILIGLFALAVRQRLKR